jgi:hypothetical protein
LRYISFSLFGREYTGNLTPFLDTKMSFVNEHWANKKTEIESLTQKFNDGTNDLISAMSANKVGRKYNSKGWETRFNRALFEVEVYYAARLPGGLLVARASDFNAAFENMCLEKSEFVDSIEASTKNIDKYNTRFTLYRDMINKALDVNIKDIPVPTRA